MICRIEELSKSRMEDITEMYFKHKISINNIMSLEGLSKNEVLAILSQARPSFRFTKEELSSFSFQEDGFMMIADTHIGHELMNMDYLLVAYEVAKEQNIHQVFHMGDLIQSTVRGVSKSLQNEEKQIEYVVDHYPKYKDIQTHILLGNHDFKTLSKQDYYMTMLKSRSDFDILGYKRCYLSWYKKLLSLNHEINSYHLILPNNQDTYYNFYGHRHDLQVKRNCVWIPTLSDDLKHYERKAPAPGLIIVSKNEQDSFIEHYVVFPDQNEQVIAVRQGIVLKKKL